VTAATALRQIADDYWAGILQRSPVLATFFGELSFNDRLPDVGPAGREAEARELRAIQGRLAVVDPSPLELEDRITLEMLSLAVQAGLDALRLRLDELAVDQLEGPQVWLAELTNYAPVDTPEHIDELAARYRAFGAFMAQYLEALQDGVRDGRTAPTVAVERVLAQLEQLLATPVDESPFAAPAPGELRAAVEQVVYPAYQQMQAYLTEYLGAAARRDPGAWAVADGAEIYALLARQHTTTDLSPAELHQIGLDDLRDIHVEMQAIMDRRGAAGLSIRAFTEQLTHDPANLADSPDELVASAERLLAEAQAALPRAFGRLPSVPVGVKAVESYRERDAPAAYYFQASPDGARPATFYINTFEPRSRPRHTLPALAFHEGVPGHHLQIALAQEATDLPRFRRLSAGWLSNAFVEGWALYTERLADELGLYPDDLARFGMLGYQAWRACRLVVDTGLHHLRWTRQQAVEFFFDNVGLTERETVNEVDRYIVWPGQALAYKIGQRQIEAVRRACEEQLGEAFDLAAFHDALLAHAAVPLSTLPLLVRANPARSPH
jgi:uncharacterized protein (DUF885 family)